ncbi:MAG: hypothetical protein KAI47_08405 [Deltaproteobacteria bacterium]|nr:hypothetical protein [Deltaproteobacteria bacterium]
MAPCSPGFRHLAATQQRSHQEKFIGALFRFLEQRDNSRRIVHRELDFGKNTAISDVTWRERASSLDLVVRLPVQIDRKKLTRRESVKIRI